MQMKEEWTFKRMQEDDFNSDPVEDVFFTTQVLEGPADSLVRECVQNTLDAAAPGEKARIVFTFSGNEKSLSPNEASLWLHGLWDHLEAAQDRLRDLPSPEDHMAFISVEDFGTKGLQGDFSQWDDLDDESGGEKNDFCYFWHNAGRSRKGTSDRGRWGLGKTVFPAASRIHTMFGFTVRRNDGLALLMGQSVLRIHKAGGVKYNPRGFWADYEEGKLPRPCQDRAVIDQFRTAFGILRDREPGLSVVIPYPERDITGPEVALSAVRHYYYPILTGQLSVEVRYNGRSVVLNDDSILDVTESLDIPGGEKEREQLRNQILLAGWGYTLPEAEYVRPKAAGMQGSAPKWAEDAFSDTDLERLREKFDSGSEIAVEASLGIQENGGNPQQTSFRIYLRRDRSSDNAVSDFIKGGVIISGVKGLERHKGVRGIVVVDQPLLSKVLGDAENPAHTEWQYKSPHFADKYRFGRSIIVYVRDSLTRIVSMLTRPSAGVDKDLLRDVFFVEQPFEPDIEGGADEGGKNKEHKEHPKITGKPPQIAVSRVSGGFVIRRATSEGPPPLKVRAEAAYEIRRGNPFRKYDVLDFDLAGDEIEIDTSGARVITAEGNRLVVAIEENDFTITVKGFDPQRDLRVRVQSVKGETNDQEV